MSDTSSLSSAFCEDLKRAAQNVCRSHGVDFGSLKGWESEDGLYLINISAHKDSMVKSYEALYLKNAEKIGLSKSWLGIYVKNPYSNESVKILGLDPDGGEECVRVENEDGERMNIKPSELLRIMTNRN